MTITTTLTWTLYDGTPETLPKEDKFAIVSSKVRADSRNYGVCVHRGDGVWEYLPVGRPIEKGDMWAYWPEAPEVEA